MVLGGSLSKAASVGANSVNGPGPWSVSTRPATDSRLTSVWKRPSSMTVCTISPSWAISIKDALSVDCSLQKNEQWVQQESSYIF
jgi:hypothetical protein